MVPNSRTAYSRNVCFNLCCIYLMYPVLAALFICIYLLVTCSCSVHVIVCLLVCNWLKKSRVGLFQPNSVHLLTIFYGHVSCTFHLFQLMWPLYASKNLHNVNSQNIYKLSKNMYPPTSHNPFPHFIFFFKRHGLFQLK